MQYSGVNLTITLLVYFFFFFFKNKVYMNMDLKEKNNNKKMTFFKFSFVSENHFRNSWYHNLIYEPLSNLQCSLTVNMHLVVSWNIPRGSISSLPPWAFLSEGRVGVGKVATGRCVLLLSPPHWNLQHYNPMFCLYPINTNLQALRCGEGHVEEMLPALSIPILHLLPCLPQAFLCMLRVKSGLQNPQ